MIQNLHALFIVKSETLLVKAYIGFFKSQFSATNIDMKTKKGSQEEPDGDKFSSLLSLLTLTKLKFLRYEVHR